jgi:integrase
MATLRARDIIEQWFKKVAADKNLSASSLNQRLVSLSMFYQFLIGELYDIREVTKGIPKFADTEPMTKKKFLDMDEAKNLINLVEKKEDKKLTEYENARNELIIKLFLGCGLRISELSKLEYKHIAIGESRIYITSDIAKFGKSRIVDIPQSVLRTYIEYLKLRKEHKNSSNFLFISRRNNVIHTNTIRHLVAKASEQATGEKINPHGLRHTYGTQQIAAGQDPLYVSQQMGHANLEITTGIYVHQAKNTQNRANNNPFFQ